MGSTVLVMDGKLDAKLKKKDYAKAHVEAHTKAGDFFNDTYGPFWEDEMLDLELWWQYGRWSVVARLTIQTTDDSEPKDVPNYAGIPLEDLVPTRPFGSGETPVDQPIAI